jgi:hypothetical protein
VKEFRLERTNLDLWNSYFRAAKRLLHSTSVSFLKLLLLVLSGPPSPSREVPPIMVDFNLDAEWEQSLHCHHPLCIIVHQIIFFRLEIHRINLCANHQCKWAGFLSRQGCLGIIWLEIYLSVHQWTISFFSPGRREMSSKNMPWNTGTSGHHARRCFLYLDRTVVELLP